jgi:transposase-like protein
VVDTGRTIAEVAREIGVGEQLLGRWVAVERARMVDPPEALDVDERAELERLRRENAELRMDREFLKKAALDSTGQRNSGASLSAGVSKPSRLRGRVLSCWGCPSPATTRGRPVGVPSRARVPRGGRTWS